MMLGRHCLPLLVANTSVHRSNSAPKMYNDLKNNTLPRFYQMTAWSFGATIILYSLVAGAGFLTFGAASNGYILNNYATGDFLMSLSRIAIAVSITASYPLLFVGSRDGLLDLFKVKERTNGLINKVTLAILAIVTLLASKLTDLGLVASLGGATFGTALVFIYPCLMLLKHQAKKGEKGNTETLLAKLIAALGVIMGAIGTGMALKGIDV
jgi:amino acid permease